MKSEYAQQVEAPKLQVHVKMTSFRSSLMDQLLKLFVHFLEEIAPKSENANGDAEHFSRDVKVRLDSTSSCSSSSASPPSK